MNEEDDGAKIHNLRSRRDPGYGWDYQSRFLTVIDSIGDEQDRLVKTLRTLRMMVMPGSPLTENAWDVVLQAAEAVLKFEDYGTEE